MSTGEGDYFRDAELRILGGGEATIDAIKGGGMERRRGRGGWEGGHRDVEGGMVRWERIWDWEGARGRPVRVRGED